MTIEKKDSWSAILLAGGQGRRMGGRPKQFRSLGGKPLWLWSLHVFGALQRSDQIKDIVLVVPSDLLEDYRKHPEVLSQNCTVVAGGAERTDSVRQGVAAAQGENVLIHDGARPFLSLDLCRKIMRKMASFSFAAGVVPVVPCSEALKKMAPSEDEVAECVDRTPLRRTQTPQAFPRREMISLLEKSAVFFDEGELWQKAGKKLLVVEGDVRNMKITYPSDMDVARALVEGEREIRTGHGYDVHPLVPGRPLILGGIRIGSQLGLQGHSDADIITHAVCDALLGAAGLPDIGNLFPASQEKYKNVCSLSLLEEVVKSVHIHGWRICWVDVTLHAQYPRLNVYREKIISTLSEFLGDGAEEKCNLKMKSGEKCGNVGRGESMECYAVATLQRNFKLE